MSVKNTIIIVGGVAVLGTLYYLYEQTSLFKESDVRIVGIDSLGLSKGKLRIAPQVEVINKSRVGLNIDSLEAEAFIPDPNGQFKPVATTSDPFEGSISPQGSTIVSPEIEVPLVNAAALVISTLINRKEEVDVLVKVKAIVNGQTLLAEEKTTISI